MLQTLTKYFSTSNQHTRIAEVAVCVFPKLFGVSDAGAINATKEC